MRNIAVLLLFGVAQWAVVSALGGEPSQPVWRVLPAGELPADARLGTPRNLRDAYHPWKPPGNKADWEQQAEAIRQRVLVSNGLWPLPPRTPLKPVIHGKIDRGDYTVEKVFFTSHPGHYVCGNLYRPKNHEGKLAGVLSPHGHWSKGRFYDAAESGGGLARFLALGQVGVRGAGLMRAADGGGDSDSKDGGPGLGGHVSSPLGACGGPLDFLFLWELRRNRGALVARGRAGK